MKAKQLCSTILLLTLCLSVAIQQSQAQQPTYAASQTARLVEAIGKLNSSPLLAHMWLGRRADFSLMPANRYARVSRKTCLKRSDKLQQNAQSPDR